MSSLRILTLARRVIQQFSTDHRTIALIIVVPLVVLTMAGILLRTDSSMVTIGMVLQDKGSTIPIVNKQINLGQSMTENLGEISSNIVIKTLSADEAEQQLEQGNLDAIVTLPEDFSQTSIAARKLNIPVKFEGSNPMAAKMTEAAITRASIQALASLSGISAQTIPPITIQSTYRYGNANFDGLDYVAPVFIGLFVFLFVFILTSVAFLRERSAGTLERLQATPIRRIEIVLGYMVGFAVFALFQSLIILGFTILGLKVHYAGSLVVVFVVEVLLALMAVNLGIFFSTFARNEFQVVQFIPLVVVTQILLSGAFWPVESMPGWLQPIAWLMPLTHANRALRDVMIKGFDFGQIWPYVLSLSLFAISFVILSSLTLKQKGSR